MVVNISYTSSTVSLMVANSVTREKVLIKCYTWKDFSLNFLEMWPKFSKTPVKLKAWYFTSRTPFYGCSQNKWLLLIKFKSCSFDVWFVLIFKVAPRVDKTDDFKKGWNFASCFCVASCTMKKTFFIMEERNGVLPSYLLLRWAILIRIQL